MISKLPEPLGLDLIRAERFAEGVESLKQTAEKHGCGRSCFELARAYFFGYWQLQRNRYLASMYQQMGRRLGYAPCLAFEGWVPQPYSYDEDEIDADEDRLLAAQTSNNAYARAWYASFSHDDVYNPDTETHLRHSATVDAFPAAAETYVDILMDRELTLNHEIRDEAELLRLVAPAANLGYGNACYSAAYMTTTDTPYWDKKIERTRHLRSISNLAELYMYNSTTEYHRYRGAQLFMLELLWTPPGEDTHCDDRVQWITEIADHIEMRRDGDSDLVEAYQYGKYMWHNKMIRDRFFPNQARNVATLTGVYLITRERCQNALLTLLGIRRFRGSAMQNIPRDVLLHCILDPIWNQTREKPYLWKFEASEERCGEVVYREPPFVV